MAPHGDFVIINKLSLDSTETSGKSELLSLTESEMTSCERDMEVKRRKREIM
jgi:hypothetical protein